MSKQKLPSLLAISTGRQDANLSEFVPYVLRDICDRGDLTTEYTWGPVPERPEILHFLGGATPYTRIMQKVGVKEDGKTLLNERGEKVTEKSVKGYVWIDADPLAVLLNKYVNASCHTLDNTYNTRAGNINYIYCPYAASVFAGKNDPSDQKQSVQPATSPITRRELYMDAAGMRVRAHIRKHQAVANAFFMRAVNNDPYLVISRCYDSCAEVPWQKTITHLFLMERCRELGIGLVYGCDSNKPWEGDITDKAVRALKEPLYTPEYEFGGGQPFAVTYYSDAGVGFAATSNGKIAATIRNGYVLLEPTRKGSEDDYAPKRTAGLRYQVIETMDAPLYVCALTGRAIGQTEMERTPDGTCYSTRAMTGVRQAISLCMDLCPDPDLFVNAYELMVAKWGDVRALHPYADCVYELAGVPLTDVNLSSYLRTAEEVATHFEAVRQRQREGLAKDSQQRGRTIVAASVARVSSAVRRKSALAVAAAEVGAEAGR